MTIAFKLFFEAAVVLVILFLTPRCVITANQTNSSHWTICEARDSSFVCQCTSNIFTDVIARCQFHHVTDLRLIIDVPENVVRINLSGNNIQEIPRNSFQNYTKLIYLSLSSNNIHTINQGAFSGLTRLRELNLQDNIIKHWETRLIQQDLPNLNMLNIAGNIYWKPDQEVFSLSKLKIIYLFFELNVKVYIYFESFGCYLVHNNMEILEAFDFTNNLTLSSKIQEKVSPHAILARRDSCLYGKLVFQDASYWDVIERSGFYFHCETVEPNRGDAHYVTPPRKLDKWYDIKETIESYCWDTMKTIHIITLIEGICAMVFNLIVIIPTVRSRVLRESVAHVLVANIAVGDLLTSFYIIIITTTRHSMDGNEFFDFYRPYYCRIVGLFFLIGQFSTTMMSFIMTLERYLAVVYCMKPHIRITRTMCYVAMVTIWSLSVSLAVSFMTQFSTTTDDICIPLNDLENDPGMFYIGGIGVLLYILAIALYGHMYLDFKRTNQKTVQLERENRLARRIAHIMFTNVFFFILPMVSVAVVTWFGDYISDGNRFIFFRTFGMICFGINSCSNPILFSFRNDKFRSEFRRHCPLRQNSVHNQSI